MRGILCVVVLVSAASWLLSVPAIADAPVYDAEYLGPVNGAAAINEAGQMVGSGTNWGNLRGWVASPGHPAAPLPLPPGMASSFAVDMNDLGVIVGTVSASSSPEFTPVAARWTPDGAGSYMVETLGMLPGHVGSNATAINNLGDIIGVSRSDMFRYPVVFTAPGGILDLSPWGIFDPTDINDQRVLVDNSFTVKRLDLDTMVVQDLGVPAGGGWLATRSDEINESSQVAGIAILSCCPNCDYHAARYTDDLGWEVLSGCGLNNMATSINDLGDVVMRLNTDVYVRFEGIGSYRLQDLISASNGQWYVFNSFGSAINSSRQIATFATNNDTGQSGLVLLHPRSSVGVDEAATSLPPSGLALAATPNPFRGTTAIAYTLASNAANASVTLRVYDASGRVLRTLVDGRPGPGRHVSVWDGTDDSGSRVPAGVYYVSARAGGTHRTGRVRYLR